MRGAASTKIKNIRDGASQRAHSFLDLCLGILLSPWKIFKVMCFVIGFVVISSSMVTGALVYEFFDSLPDIERMHFSTVVDLAKRRVAERMGTRAKRLRWVRIKDINREVLFAVVLSEDATFYEHNGVNMEAVIDAFAENLKKRDLVHGGSTISQQVVKNVFLTRDKTFMRKLKEYFITRRMEDKFDKNEILELYLNLAEFGPDIYGIDAAAQHYFNNAPSGLNAVKGAFLGMLLPSPRRYYLSVWKNQHLSFVKRQKIERVLRDMRYQEYLTQNQHDQYIKHLSRHIFGDGFREPAHKRD